MSMPADGECSRSGLGKGWYLDSVFYLANKMSQ